MFSYLAAERAESERIQEASIADLADVRDAFPRPRLRPLIQKHNPRAVDDVGLDATNIQNSLYLRNPNHIVVRRSTNLQKTDQNPLKLC